MLRVGSVGPISGPLRSRRGAGPPRAPPRARRPALPPRFGAQSPLKVYVRDAGDLARVAALLEQRLPASVPRILLQGLVCRRELAVEIDGVHA